MQTVRNASAARFFAAVVSAIAMTQVGAQATSTAADNARFLADLTVTAQFEQSIQAARKQMPEMMKQMAATAGDSGASAARDRYMNRIPPLLDKMMERMAMELAKPEIRGKLSDAVFASVNRIYSAAEIDSLAAYYRTPMGVAVVAKQGALMGDLMPATSAITMHALQPAVTEFMEAAKKLAAEPAAATK